MPKTKRRKCYALQIPFTAFTYARYIQLLEALQKAYPFAAFSVFGRSTAGRGLFALQIGEGTQDVLLCSGFGGCDNAAPLLLLRFFTRLCACYRADRSLCRVRVRASLQGRRVTIVPCLDPDAQEIRRYGALGAGRYAGLVARAAAESYSGWCANARGVEIAQNFLPPASTANRPMRPSPFGYSGPAPESETETQALVRLCRRAEFRHALCLHGSGQTLAYAAAETAAAAPLSAKVLAGAAEYRLLTPSENASGNQFPFWFSHTFHRPAFTAAPAETPIASAAQFDAAYHEIEELLLLASIL